MKKRFIAVALVLAMSVTAISGCGKKKEEEAKDTTQMTAEELQEVVLKDVEDYVTVKDYSDLKVEVAPVAEVTDGAVETELESWLSFYPLAFEGTCASGDSVNIDYVGTVDGKEFEGGSYEGYDLQLGSGTFIPGFEEQVEGMSVGDTKDINVTFPEDYSSDEVAGKAAVFKVTLNYITKSEGSGTLNEQWVEAVVEKEAISDKVTDLTVDGFKKFVKTTLEEEAESDHESAIAQGILSELNKISNYDKVPEEVKEQYIADEREYQEEYITNQYGMELAEYLEAVSIDEETFNADIEKSAIDYMHDVLSLKAIAIKEKIKVSQEDYDEYLQTYAEYYGSESLDAFKKEYASEYGTDLFESLLLEKVLEHLKEEITITESKDAATAE